MINVRLNENLGSQLSAMFIIGLTAKINYQNSLTKAQKGQEKWSSAKDDFYSKQENFDMRYLSSKDFFAGKTTVKPTQVRINALEEFNKIDMQMNKYQLQLNNLNLRLYNNKKRNILKSIGRVL